MVVALYDFEKPHLRTSPVRIALVMVQVLSYVLSLLSHLIHDCRETQTDEFEGRSGQWPEGQVRKRDIDSYA